LNNVDIHLMKSKTTLEILHMIEKEPRIYINEIAKRLGLNHKTVKYHVSKLVENNLIVIEKQGKKNFLTPKLMFDTNMNTIPDLDE
nr:winged helix-turn-helix domain-containing protein [Candidatus Sigynarchaeota archaeon]